MIRRLSAHVAMLLALLTAVMPVASGQPRTNAGPICCCATGDPDSGTSCRCCDDTTDPVAPCDCEDGREGLPLALGTSKVKRASPPGIPLRSWSTAALEFRQAPWVKAVEPVVRSGPDVFVWNCIWLI